MWKHFVNIKAQQSAQLTFLHAQTNAIFFVIKKNQSKSEHSNLLIAILIFYNSVYSAVPICYRPGNRWERWTGWLLSIALFLWTGSARAEDTFTIPGNICQTQRQSHLFLHSFRQNTHWYWTTEKIMYQWTWQIVVLPMHSQTIWKVTWHCHWQHCCDR